MCDEDVYSIALRVFVSDESFGSLDVKRLTKLAIYASRAIVESALREMSMENFGEDANWHVEVHDEYKWDIHFTGRLDSFEGKTGDIEIDKVAIDASRGGDDFMTRMVSRAMFSAVDIFSHYKYHREKEQQ